MKLRETLLREAKNLGPIVVAAKDAADADSRPGDWAVLCAVENFLVGAVEELHEEAAADAAPAVPSLRVTEDAMRAVAADARTKHRHKFDDAGRCAVVAGCEAKPRAKKPAPAEAPAPAAPAEGGGSAP